MWLDVATFRERTRFGLDELVAELQEPTRRAVELVAHLESRAGP